MSRDAFICWLLGQLSSRVNVKQMVGRALQFANSTPKGPSYLACAREVLAQELTPYSLDQTQWGPIRPNALPADAVSEVASALVNA